MKPYRHANWIAFRREVIKLHKGVCARCGRQRSDGVVLQAHHKRYIPGRMPWEYEHADCEALCKGCHAQEHGLIAPQSGWQCVGVDDLGDIAGNCELCGQDIRYVYAITHANWDGMAVGTDCCDKLTGTAEASEHHDRHIKLVEMRTRFVKSKRWKLLDNGNHAIRQKGIDVVIERTLEGTFLISMDGAKGRVEHGTILDAKLATFESIQSGKAAAYLAKRKATRGRTRQMTVEELKRGLGFLD